MKKDIKINVWDLIFPDNETSYDNAYQTIHSLIFYDLKDHN